MAMQNTSFLLGLHDHRGSAKVSPGCDPVYIIAHFVKFVNTFCAFYLMVDVFCLILLWRGGGSLVSWLLSWGFLLIKGRFDDAKGAECGKSVDRY